uniref:Uncharacterized protein n=1 Tax=Anguilla anguilla TaxID=7936 RepID=A0A0E9RJY9_ANGAN
MCLPLINCSWYAVYQPAALLEGLAKMQR